MVAGMNRDLSLRMRVGMRASVTIVSDFLERDESGRRFTSESIETLYLDLSRYIVKTNAAGDFVTLVLIKDQARQRKPRKRS